jgi:hypothetical protein
MLRLFPSVKTASRLVLKPQLFTAFSTVSENTVRITFVDAQVGGWGSITS